jgi:hypothetical protein
MESKPYVGITGPVSSNEVYAICNEFSDAGFNMETPHIPMLGYLVSYKTLNCQAGNRRYPLFGMLPDLINEARDVMTMIHYNSSVDGLANQVEQVFDSIYDNCKALQLNIPWPDVSEVRKIKEHFPEMQIVFQASGKVMKDKTPAELKERIAEYGDTISYVLVDPSGGRGQPFDIGHSVELYEELKELPLTIGMAGGFNENNTANRLRELVRTIGHDNFCIDVEGGLRDKLSDAYGDDLLNLEKVTHYLQAASLVIK